MTLFIIVIVGYVAGKLGFLGGDFDRQLSRVVINITCPALILVSAEDHVVPLLRKLYREQEAAGKKACVLCFSEHVASLSGCRPHDIGSSASPADIAHRLFDVLRRLDEEGMEMVFSEVIPPEGFGLAVMNRLGRAASFRTIQA